MLAMRILPISHSIDVHHSGDYRTDLLSSKIFQIRSYNNSTLHGTPQSISSIRILIGSISAV